MNILLPAYGAIIIASILVLAYGVPSFFRALPKFKRKQKKVKASEYTGMGSIHDAY